MGSIPLFGDIFDIVWKANRGNYPLMQCHLVQPRRNTWRDWAFLLVIVLGLALIIAIPVALALWFIAWLMRQ